VSAAFKIEPVFPRVLRFLNLSIAVLIVALAAAAWWFAYRPVPSSSGQMRAPVSTRATVVRDKYGVPHILAANVEDAVFLQGYTTAQDRMWQMDALRRLAAGELSEIIGRQTIEVDRESRRLGLRRIAEAAARNIAPEDYKVLAAYARGVNYYLETNRGRYGLEFSLLRYDPRPWTVSDSILAGLEMYRQLTTTWREEVQKMQLASAPQADRAKVDYLFPSWTGREAQPGSNAWALSGALTASGKPLLANDPHLGFSLPSTWYEVHLQAPGLNVEGVSLPGIPCVIIGHNDRIAWGVTNLGYDIQDLYREQINIQTGQYLYRGAAEQAARVQEAIAIKGEKTEVAPIWITRHGPVFLSDNGQWYAMRWAAAEPGFAFPFLDLNRARDWTSFTAALERYPGPAQNFVYADVDGNIGYHATGKLPIRRGYDGSVPVDGSTGEFEWDGFIPFEELPWFYNPPSGMIVTANQNPFPHDYKYPVHGQFASQYRSKQIRDMLSARKGWKAADLIAVQKDVYSPFSHFLAQQIVAAYDRSNPKDSKLAPAVDALRGWNGQMDKESSAALVAQLAYAPLKKAIARCASPKMADAYDIEIAHGVVENLLRARPKDWGIDWDKTLLSALADGINQGSQQQGSNVPGWKYGKYNELTLENRIAGAIPVLGRYFNIGPVWMSGSGTSVKQTTQRLGPSMRFVADLSDWEQSLNNITIGESGHRLSSHYKDQWDAYYYGRGIPMQYGRVEGKGTVTVEPGR
jgi:penicillin amidase